MKNKPQLSAELIETIETIIEYVVVESASEPDGERLRIKTSDELEDILRPILTNKLATTPEDERNKVIEEVRELIAYSSFEMTPGGRPMKRTCSVEEAMRQLEKDVAKLNQRKGITYDRHKTK